MSQTRLDAYQLQPSDDAASHPRILATLASGAEVVWATAHDAGLATEFEATFYADPGSDPAITVEPLGAASGAFKITGLGALIWGDPDGAGDDAGLYRSFAGVIAPLGSTELQVNDPVSATSAVPRDYVDGLISASGHTNTDLDQRYVTLASAQTIPGTKTFTASYTAIGNGAGEARLILTASADTIPQVHFSNPGNAWTIGGYHDYFAVTDWSRASNAIFVAASGQFGGMILMQGGGDVTIGVDHFVQSAAPTIGDHLTNKRYVDAAASAVAWTAASAASAAAVSRDIATATYDARYFMLASAQSITAVHDFSASLPTASAQPTGSAQLANKIYVDTASAAALNAALAADITTATYDARYAQTASAETITARWNFDASLPQASATPTGSADLTNKIYTDRMASGASAAAVAADIPTATYDARYFMLASAQSITAIHDFSASLPTASAQPTGSAQFANKLYVDTASAAALAAAIAADITTATYDARYAQTASAETITGRWNFDAALPQASATPAGSADLTNKAYVDAASAAADARFVNVTGDYMTGDLIMSSAAIKVLSDTTDAQLTINPQGTTGGAKLLIARGNGGAGFISRFILQNLSGSKDLQLLDLNNNRDVLTASANGDFMLLRNGQGNVVVSSASVVDASKAPTASGHLTNKLYVDNASAAAVAAAIAADITTATYDSRYAQTASAETITARWNFDASLPQASATPAGSADLTNKLYVDSTAWTAASAASAAAYASAAGAFVYRAGDTMTGDLVLNIATAGNVTLKGAAPIISASATASANAAYVKTFSRKDGGFWAASENQAQLFLSNNQGVKYAAIRSYLSPGAASAALSLQANSAGDGEINHLVMSASATYVGGNLANYHVYPGSAGTLWHGYAAPTASAHLTNKAYVNSQWNLLDGRISIIEADYTTDSELWSAASAASAAAVAADIPTATYDARYAQTASAETITARWNFDSSLPQASATPTGSADLTNKQYVDAGDAGSLASGKAYTDTKILASGYSLANLDARYLNASGDVASGDMHFLANFSVNLDTTLTGLLEVGATATFDGPTFTKGVITASGSSYFTARGPGKSFLLTGTGQMDGTERYFYIESAASSGAVTWSNGASTPRYMKLSPTFANPAYNDLQMGGPAGSAIQISVPYDPQTADGLTRKQYVDSVGTGAMASAVTAVGSAFVHKAGDTMTGNLTVASLGGVGQAHVTASGGANQDGVLVAIGPFTPSVNIQSGDQTTQLQMIANMASGVGGLYLTVPAVSGAIQHVAASALSTFIGGASANHHVYPGSATTMWHGYAAPTASAHLTNKTYVDRFLPGGAYGSAFVKVAGDTMTGSLTVNTGIGATGKVVVTNFGRVQAYSSSADANATVEMSPSLKGITMGAGGSAATDWLLGWVAPGVATLAGGNLIRCTIDPVSANDLARKSYVDFVGRAVDGGSPSANYLFQADFDGGAPDMVFQTAKILDGGVP